MRINSHRPPSRYRRANETTLSGHTLESAYWTGDVWEVEQELNNLEAMAKRWEDKDLEYESVADFVSRLLEK